MSQNLLTIHRLDGCLVQLTITRGRRKPRSVLAHTLAEGLRAVGKLVGLDLPIQNIVDESYAHFPCTAVTNNGRGSLFYMDVKMVSEIFDVEISDRSPSILSHEGQLHVLPPSLPLHGLLVLKDISHIVAHVESWADFADRFPSWRFDGPNKVTGSCMFVKR